MKETLYDWPDTSTKRDGLSAPLHAKKETIYKENEVAYMSDEVSAAMDGKLLNLFGSNG